MNLGGYSKQTFFGEVYDLLYWGHDIDLDLHKDLHEYVYSMYNENLYWCNLHECVSECVKRKRGKKNG